MLGNQLRKITDLLSVLLLPSSSAYLPRHCAPRDGPLFLGFSIRETSRDCAGELFTDEG